ncbi:DUF922 domain-containing protein [Aeromonas enteropelogenes]|uniref:DUF922 domain-containing protein n=1 Tax=Aeromonas enteropelogenes TaxID=29489 RepID=UPI003BA33840
MVSKFHNMVVGIGLLLLPLASQAQTVRPQVVPESRINVRFYDVNATSPDQLASAIVQSAPRVNGKVVLGKASYQVDWQLETEQLPGRCQLTQVTVLTQATVLLPRWSQSRNSTGSARDDWARVLSSMFEYESRFKEMVQRGSSLVGGAIAALPSHGDCQALRYAAWAAGSKEMEKIRERIDAFQEQTGYGERFGVHWPN